MNAHNKMFKPPALHASSTGGAETNTAARPPSAVYPIIPKLINPAYPHWILAPIVITAEIKHKHKIDNAILHDWRKPTRIIRPNIIEYAAITSKLFLIKLSL